MLAEPSFYLGANFFPLFVFARRFSFFNRLPILFIGKIVDVAVSYADFFQGFFAAMLVDVCLEEFEFFELV